MTVKNLEARVKHLEDEVHCDYCLCLEPRPGQTEDECIEEFYAEHPWLRGKNHPPFLLP